MKRKMKVAFLTHWYPENEYDIKDIFIKEYAKAISFFDDIVVIHWVGFSDNIRVERTDHTVPTFRVWTLPPPKMYGLTDIWHGIHLARIIKDLKIDIIHANVYIEAFRGAVAALILRKKYFITEHASSVALGNLDRKTIAKIKFSFKIAKAVLPVSKFLAERIRRYVNARIFVVPNPVNTDLFRPSKKKNFEERRKNVVWVGRFVEVKDPELLADTLNVLTKRRGINVNLVGWGELENKFKKLIPYANFWEPMGRAKLASFLRRQGVLLITSKVETFSCITAESISSGVPVVAVKRGALPELVTDECGKIEDPDPFKLADAIEYVLDNLEFYDPQRLHEIIKEKFSYHVVGSKVHEIYSMI